MRQVRRREGEGERQRQKSRKMDEFDCRLELEEWAYNAPAPAQRLCVLTPSLGSTVWIGEHAAAADSCMRKRDVHPIWDAHC